MATYSLNALKKILNKEHGKGTIGSVRVARKRIPRISTQSISFDRATGGGIPVGRTTIFRGDESSGKTTNALRVVASAQSLCANCYRPAKELEVIEGVDDEGEVFYWADGYCDCYKEGVFEPKQYVGEKDADFKSRLKVYEENSFCEMHVAFFDPEGSYDIEWSEKLGVDNGRLLYVQADTTEEICDIYDAMIRTGEVDLLVLDSIAAMTPSSEVEKSFEDWDQGMQARLMNKFIRKVQTGINVVLKEKHRFVTNLWINQFREKIGGFGYGDNRTAPGGNGQKFAPSLVVDFWTSKWEKESRDKDLTQDLQSEFVTSVRINFKCSKNKTATPKQTGSYVMITEGEDIGKIDEFRYVIGMAGKLGIYREEGEGSKKKWYLGDEEFSKKKDFTDRINEPAVYAKVRNVVLENILNVTSCA